MPGRNLPQASFQQPTDVKKLSINLSRCILTALYQEDDFIGYRGFLQEVGQVLKLFKTHETPIGDLLRSGWCDGQCSPMKIT